MPCPKHASAEATKFQSQENCIACYMVDSRTAIDNLFSVVEDHAIRIISLEGQLAEVQRDVFSLIPEEPDPVEPTTGGHDESASE